VKDLIESDISMNYQKIISQELKEAQIVLDNFLSDPEQIEKIEKAAGLMAEAIIHNGKILSCGNGGSHCDAMHFAEELTGRYRDNRRALPAIAISDVSHLSCVSNDFGYEYVFSRYIEALGQPGDVLLGLSTSGNSANIIRAAEAAKAKGMKIIIMSGKDGGKLAGVADIEIRVPHFGYADRIQEIHIKVIHIFMLLIEKMVLRE
jgi:D-sedoheptulose 7-phosphate isomerase